MDSTIIYLIKNSEVTPKANLKKIVSKEYDELFTSKSFLSVSGEKRAEQLSKYEELQNIDSVYSSSNISALETAKYIALENNTIINIDDRLNEYKIGDMGDIDYKELYRLRTKDYNFKLSGGESFNQVKKRITEALKSIIMFETGNRIAVVSHEGALTSLLSSWCNVGHNYDDEIILSFNDKTIVDGSWTSPHVFKVTFDGMEVIDIEYLNIV